VEEIFFGGGQQLRIRSGANINTSAPSLVVEMLIIAHCENVRDISQGLGLILWNNTTSGKGTSDSAHGI